LNYSDRSIIKLIENFSCFSDKLPINGVYESITSIICNAKKISGLKNETKQALDEFAQKVEKCRKKGTNEERENEDEVQQEAATEAENVA
jgi:condensin complex subunit 1 (fragment)